ncbi:MAG: hypothetical protein E6G10_23235 [Actinobacteria bacterium]|nr:MAG: hypothetical protein E6G10_23235 [Actinomycetota bacterium]
MCAGRGDHRDVGPRERRLDELEDLVVADTEALADLTRVPDNDLHADAPRPQHVVDRDSLLRACLADRCELLELPLADGGAPRTRGAQHPLDLDADVGVERVGGKRAVGRQLGLQRLAHATRDLGVLGKEGVEQRVPRPLRVTCLNPRHDPRL